MWEQVRSNGVQVMMKQRVKILRPLDLVCVLDKWAKQRQENFVAITLDGSHSVIKVHHITKGLINRTLVHPRECFYPAVKDYATSVVFAHNHPSGNPEPSSEDHEVTSRLCMAGSILGFNVLDHLIITKNNGYYSFQQNGKITDYSCKDSNLSNFVDRLAAER